MKIVSRPCPIFNQLLFDGHYHGQQAQRHYDPNQPFQYNFDFQNSGNTKTIFSLIEKTRELGCYVPIL